MPAHVVVTLDTTAPQVTFGEPEGAAGQAITVPYELDEPSALQARFVDISGQVFPLTLHPADVSGALAAAIPGLARVEIRTRDDVMNTAWRSLSFQLAAGPTLEGLAEIAVDSMRADMSIDPMTTDLAVDSMTTDLAVDPMDADLEVD